MAIAVTSLALARALTGFELRTAAGACPRPSPRPHDAARRTPRARARGVARRGAADPREVLAGPIVAAVTLLVAFWATQRADVPLRDPDHVAALYFVLVGLRRRGDGAARHRDPPARAARRARRWRACARERWTRARCVAVGGAHPRLLPQLHGLSEPEGDRAAAAAGHAVRPPARRPRPRPVPRPRPGAAAALAARHRASRRTSSPAATSRSSSSCRCRSALALVFSRRPPRRRCSSRRRCRPTG